MPSFRPQVEMEGDRAKQREERGKSVGIVKV